MDCSQTGDGYFEVKGYLNGQWESDISQGQCTGQLSKKFEMASKNHVARYQDSFFVLNELTDQKFIFQRFFCCRCGYINVFEWNSAACQMEPLS